jgi:hypothetical protein
MLPKKNISELFEAILVQKQLIQEWYVKYTETATCPEMLDSFLFQKKILEMEYEHYYKLYQFIENRTYGDYYKLFVSIFAYNKTTYDLDVKKYPVYKDLEPYKQYESYTEFIHTEIENYLLFLEELIKEKQKELDEHKAKIVRGLNIGNYVNMLTHQVDVMNDQLHLFKNHFTTYNTYHDKRYTDLSVQLKLVLARSTGTTFPLCSVCCTEPAEYCKECCSRMEVRGTVYEKELTNEVHANPPPEPVEPTPEPVVEPTPEPEPVVEPTPEPVVEPTPEPVVEPTPEPVVEPTPEPVVEPTPEPVVEPTPEPEPVVEPTPEPVVEPTPEPVVEPTPEQVVEPTPESVVESPPEILVEYVHYDIPIDIQTDPPCVNTVEISHVVNELIEKIVNDFNELLKKVEKKNFNLCGFRIINFDIPWILHKLFK